MPQQTREDTPVIIENLSKWFGARQVIDSLSFTVEPGRITGFLGPNGAGKTTTLRILLGLVKADTGSARFGQHTYSELSLPTRTVGSALDSSGFHPGMRVIDHLTVQAMASGTASSRIKGVIEVTGLEAYSNIRIGKLSLGMKQRLNLADALIGDPAVLILDEPTNGLDPYGIAWLREFLRQQADVGRTVLVSSHLLTEAENMIDDVVLIHEGRLLRASSLQEWRASEVGSLLVSSSDPHALVSSLKTATTSAELVPGGLVRTFGVSQGELQSVAFANRIEVSGCVDVDTTLEQLFFSAIAQPVRERI